MKTRRTPKLQYLTIEVAIFVMGLILSWLTAFLASYIIVRIFLYQKGIPWAKMDEQEQAMALNLGGLGCFPGIIVSILIGVQFDEIVLSMITVPSIITWFLGIMIASALGFKLAISKKE